MTSQGERLKLYEALELRSELDARIKTIKDCLPETRQNRSRLLSFREDGNRRPSPDFDIAAERKRQKRLELRRRKLNAAIQQANFRHRVEHDGESMTLSEALEVRKVLNEAIGELHGQLVDAAWQRVIYKEDRDIVEESELSYAEAAERLETARLAFRSLNRQLRASRERLVPAHRSVGSARSEGHAQRGMRPARQPKGSPLVGERSAVPRSRNEPLQQ